VSRSDGSHAALIIFVEKWSIGAGVCIFGRPTEWASGKKGWVNTRSTRRNSEAHLSVYGRSRISCP